MTALGLAFVTGLSGAALCCLTAEASAQQIHIHLDFDQEMDQVSPQPRLITRVVQENATLDPSGAISSTVESNSGGHGKKRQQMSETNEIKLGGSSGNEWKVAGKDKLINIVDFYGFKRAILLTINGSSCTAEVDFERKPGFSDYQFKRPNGSIGVASSVVARRLNCSVQPGG